MICSCSVGPLALSLSLSSCCFGVGGTRGGGFVAFKNLPTLLLTYTKHTKLCLIRIWSDRWKWWSSPPPLPPSHHGGCDSSYTYPKWHNWPRVCSMMTQGFVLLFLHMLNTQLALRDWSMMTHCDETLYLHKKHTHTHTQLCLRMDWWWPIA